jgi:hypothetical protein
MCLLKLTARLRMGFGDGCKLGPDLHILLWLTACCLAQSLYHCHSTQSLHHCQFTHSLNTHTSQAHSYALFLSFNVSAAVLCLTRHEGNSVLWDVKQSGIYRHRWEMCFLHHRYQMNMDLFCPDFPGTASGLWVLRVSGPVSLKKRFGRQITGV